MEKGKSLFVLQRFLIHPYLLDAIISEDRERGVPLLVYANIIFLSLLCLAQTLIQVLYLCDSKMVVVVYFLYSSHHFTTPSKHICIETIQTYKRRRN